jgi:hypothetical protein
MCQRLPAQHLGCGWPSAALRDRQPPRQHAHHSAHCIQELVDEHLPGSCCGVVRNVEWTQNGNQHLRAARQAHAICSDKLVRDTVYHIRTLTGISSSILERCQQRHVAAHVHETGHAGLPMIRHSMCSLESI